DCACFTRSQTRWIMGLPCSGTNGLPGRRVDAYRAGMTARMLMTGPYLSKRKRMPKLCLVFRRYAFLDRRAMPNFAAFSHQFGVQNGSSSCATNRVVDQQRKLVVQDFA